MTQVSKSFLHLQASARLLLLPRQSFFSGFANVAQVPGSADEGLSGFANIAQVPTAAAADDECEDFVMAMEEMFGGAADAEGASPAADASGGATPTGTGSPAPDGADIPLPGVDADDMGIHLDGPADAAAPADGEVHVLAVPAEGEPVRVDTMDQLMSFLQPAAGGDEAGGQVNPTVEALLKSLMSGVKHSDSALSLMHKLSRKKIVRSAYVSANACVQLERRYTEHVLGALTKSVLASGGRALLFVESMRADETPLKSRAKGDAGAGGPADGALVPAAEGGTLAWGGSGRGVRPAEIGAI